MAREALAWLVMMLLMSALLFGLVVPDDGRFYEDTRKLLRALSQSPR